MNDPIVTHVCRSIEEIEKVRQVWTSFKCHPNSHIDFYLRVVKSLPGILRPHVLVLHRNGKPEAMLIGRLEQKNVVFRIVYKSLYKIRDRSLTFIYVCFYGLHPAINPEHFIHVIM